MSFVEIEGNHALKGRLLRLVANKSIPQCSIFEGPVEQALKIAESFAQTVLCTDKKDDDACGVCNSCRKIQNGNSEEIHIFGTVNADKPVKVGMVREMRDMALSKSYTGRPEFMIVQNTARMLEGAQSAMLKLLEEPPQGVYILLVTENAESLVKTIRSRCQIFRVEAASAVEFDGEQSSNTVELLEAIVTGKSFFEIQELINYFTKDKSRLFDFLEIAEIFFRDILVSSYDKKGILMTGTLDRSFVRRCASVCNVDFIEKGIEAVELARRDLAGNVSGAHALKYMIFDIQSRISAPCGVLYKRM